MKTRTKLMPPRSFQALFAVMALLLLPACTVYDASYGVAGGPWGNSYVVGSTWNTLPVGYQTVFWNGSPYYVYGNHFFVRRGPRYVCVRRPGGRLFYRNGRRFHRHHVVHRPRPVLRPRPGLRPRPVVRPRPNRPNRPSVGGNRPNRPAVGGNRPNRPSAGGNRPNRPNAGGNRPNRRPAAQANPRPPRVNRTPVSTAGRGTRPRVSRGNRGGSRQRNR